MHMQDLKCDTLHMPPGANLLLWFSCFFSYRSKLLSFEETLNLTFGCLRKKGVLVQHSNCIRYVWPDHFCTNLRWEALFNIVKWMLIDTPPSEYFHFFFTIYLYIMVWWLTSVGRISYVNVFKPSLMKYPYLKIFFLELLPEEYLKLRRVVGWKLISKSWLLSFPLWCFTGS